MISKKNIIDYFMILVLIFISGNISFTSKSILFTTFILSTLLFIYRKQKFDKKFTLFSLLLFVILLLQSVKFDFFPIETYLGVFIRILIAYFILRSIGNSFIDKFIKVMYYLSIISLGFYFSILLIPNLEQVYVNNFTTYAIIDPHNLSRYSVFGIYTIIPEADDLIKSNSGPFWEMGAFGGYLVLALIFNLLNDDNLKNKVNLVLIITIITTQSTTAFIALFMLLFFIYYQKFKSIASKIIITLFILVSSYYAYTSLDFLGKKIEHQLKMASVVNTSNLQNADTQRFINILKDWNDFQGHEFIGRGPNSITRYSSTNKNEIRTVGTTDMIVRYGLAFFLLIIYLMYRSIESYSRSIDKGDKIKSIGIVIVILTLLMSETYFLYSLFWILIFLQYVYNIDKEEIDV